MSSRENATQARFGSCRLDLEAHRLWREDREVHLSPKAFELLKVLIDNRPRALGKAELLELVWPGTYVSDASLARVVTEVRRAIGDHARDPRYVRTVHGFGYAFAAPVTPVPTGDDEALAPGPRCWLVLGSREFLLCQGESRIGRAFDASIRLESARVSRHHARITTSGGEATLEDLGSRNGTYLRGQRISGPRRLEHGDEIQVGSFRLVFRVTAATGLTETVGDAG